MAGNACRHTHTHTNTHLVGDSLLSSVKHTKAGRPSYTHCVCTKELSEAALQPCYSDVGGFHGQVVRKHRHMTSDARTGAAVFSIEFLWEQKHDYSAQADALPERL